MIKKINNKGLTLIELLISIILIGIVLGFLFQLLTDVKDESEGKNYSYNNQLTKANVINVIENDLNNNMVLSNIDSQNINSEELKDLNIEYNDEQRAERKEFIINFYNSAGNGNNHRSFLYYYAPTFSDPKREVIPYLIYVTATGQKKMWYLRKSEADTCVKIVYNTNRDRYYFKIIIKIYDRPYSKSNNAENNNPIDDIEITYAGDAKNITNIYPGPTNDFQDLTNTNPYALLGNSYFTTTIGQC